jgi:hypothetical protein
LPFPSRSLVVTVAEIKERSSMIPLDTAVTLASVASSNKGSGVHFQVDPSRQDIEDAIEVLNKLNKRSLLSITYEVTDI